MYLIISAASQLFFTMMCDVFSHGPLWIIAGVLSTIGSGVCGGSMNLAELIIGRLVQGIGGGGATAICFVIMADTIPESIQSRYSCYILLVRLIGSMLGPAVGGLFIDNGSWTWASYFNFVFCGLGLLLIPISVDLRVSKNIPLRKLRIMDWSGATMALLGPSSILIGLGWGGTLYQWTEWRTLMPIAVGLATLIALVLYESMWALHPLFGAKVFRSPAAIMTYVGCFCHGLVVSAIRFFFFFFSLSLSLLFFSDLSGD
jgi:MFS family permease